MRTSSKVMAAAAVIATFAVPAVIGFPVIALCAGGLAYRGVKHVSKNYLPTKRHIFFKGKDKDTSVTISDEMFDRLLESGIMEQ